MRVPSRRLANLSYIFWLTYQVLAFLAFQLMVRLILLYIDQNSKRLAAEFRTRGGGIKALTHFQRQDLHGALSKVNLASPGASLFTPAILSAMNYNSMVFFLLANLLTGLVNLSIDTRQLKTFASMLILTIYLTVITSVAYFLYAKKIRVPLRFSSLSRTVLIKLFLFLMTLLFCLAFLKTR
ncbi:hypothetical protein RvY_00257-6 [Ramazzottius varieornatus]|nr:hypothetical protein RvY_00257-6 [Ramazzottius varieornatus]